MIRWITLAALGVGLGLMADSLQAGEGAATPAARKINVVVVTGGHPFKEKEFLNVFEGCDDIAPTHSSQKVGGEIFEDISAWKYDAIVLYNFNQKITETQQQNFLKLMDKGVGLLILHHANGAYNNWPEFWKIAGVTYHFAPWEENGKTIPRSGFKGNVTFKIHVADPNHPITRGMTDYAFTDETYCRTTIDPGVHTLLTTDEPSSDQQIGWVKTYRKANVCYLQSGHDPVAYNHKEYKPLVARAIRWVAGRLNDSGKAGAAAVKPAAAASSRGSRAAVTVYAAPRAEAEKPPAAKKVNVALITGGHAYDQKPFLAMFEAMGGITFTHLDEQKTPGKAFDDISAWPYDAIVLYNHNQKLTDTQKANFLKLLERGVGLVILHHAAAAYPDWPEFDKIFGGRYYLKDETDDAGVTHARCRWKHDVDFKIHVEDTQHPITAGVADFAIHDETYVGYSVAPSVHLLLTTDDPTSEKAIGWAKTYSKTRVCFLESGHDAKAYASKDLQTLLARAIDWTAGRLPEGDLTPSNYKPSPPSGAEPAKPAEKTPGKRAAKTR